MNTSLPKILITGGDGQVASALKKVAANYQANLIFCARSEADITSPSSIENAINQHQPDIIINTAAYTAVDQAETQSDEAHKINVDGARNLANACQQHRIILIHLSTDYVFDGNSHHGYKENDAVHPINIYGKSKLLGEEAIRSICSQHIIVRVSGVFSEYKSNFLKTILKLTQQKNLLRIVNDQTTCPTYAGDIANMLLKIASHPKHMGTYHFCSAPPVSWYGFASEIVKQADISTVVLEPIPASDYLTPAKRPAYSVLDCTKIKNDYAISQPDWKTGIHSALFALITTS
jgi:dTDP-4-dehydrorhamnose reductase